MDCHACDSVGKGKRYKLREWGHPMIDKEWVGGVKEWVGEGVSRVKR